MNRYIAHPWHGVPLGQEQPNVVNAFIEITPSDTVKYELDKITGILKIDRPQLFSNICPTLYGILPQTLCGERVADHCRIKFARKEIVGDNDPLDICVLTEKLVTHGNILLEAIPIGGLKLIDNNEADDKITACYLKRDYVSLDLIVLFNMIYDPLSRIHIYLSQDLCSSQKAFLQRKAFWLSGEARGRQTV
jgi:inorganic pyrophosphatase